MFGARRTVTRPGSITRICNPHLMTYSAARNEGMVLLVAGMF
jgi:hypothetical protein